MNKNDRIVTTSATLDRVDFKVKGGGGGGGGGGVGVVRKESDG